MKSSVSHKLDADYAAETTALARTQVTEQAGTAMLTQANQSQQAILALLREESRQMAALPRGHCPF